MSFPANLTNAVDGITDVMADHLNNLEGKVGVDSSLVATSLDYLLKNAVNPGHLHTTIKSPATTGLAQFTGMGAGATRIYTLPNANATIAAVGIVNIFTTYQQFSVAAAQGGNAFWGTEETNTGTGVFTIQAGAGSLGYGGGLLLFAHSHATKPGWVVAGISSSAGSGAAEGRFTVNDQGLGGGTDLFTVLRSGKVGIGTMNPGATLNVIGAKTAYGGVVYIDDSAARALGVGGGIVFRGKVTGGLYEGAAITSYKEGNDDDYGTSLKLRTTNSVGTMADAVTINSTGNVGIRTSTFGTSAIGVLGLGSGTAPSTAPANIGQVWVEDINGEAGFAGLHKMTETTAVKEVIPGVIIKGTTGSPADPYEGLMEINTFDNKINMYADAGWRQLVTW